MILLDISTTYQFRHWQPVGILRVEREVLAALRDRFGKALACVVYDPDSDAFYRIPDPLLESLLLAPAGHAVTRAETATSALRSRLRVARFLWRCSRRTRAVTQTGPQGHRAREQILGEEVLRLSLEEYGLLNRTVRRLGRVTRRFSQRAALLDSINHRAHFGLLAAGSARIFTPANRVDPEEGGHSYVTVGSFWADGRYRLARKMREAHGWTIHCLIYDLVPILWRHVAEPHTRESFPTALHWLLWGVDQIWTISQTTTDDLLQHVRSHGYPEPDPRWLRSIPLGCEIPVEAPEAEESRNLLAAHGLRPDGYVLMVGTQEPRKNHAFAYALWREMNIRQPGRVLPLVWVGQPGWGVAPLLETVASDHGLAPGAIRLMPDVADGDLVTLYRNCRFTIYPSHYEGWGLPVVESLNFGKPCLTSDAPAMTEAARGHNEAIGLFEGERWIARLLELMQDDLALAKAKARLAGFKGYRWAQFREGIADDFGRYLQGDTALERIAS